MPVQPNRLNLAVFVCAAAVVCSPAQSAAESPTRAVSVSRVAADVIERTNVERSHNRRAALRANPRLMRAAQLQAEQMARARRMAHVLPDAPYPRMVDRVAAADYRWYTVGENVAF